MNPHNRPTEESKGSDSGSDSEDLIIGDTEPGAVGPSSPLPSPEWMSGVRQELEHWSGLSLVTESEPVHVSACPEIVPNTCDFILGDGNCLFRALSKELAHRKTTRLCELQSLTLSNIQIMLRCLAKHILERRLKKCISVGYGGHLGKSVRLLHSSKLIFSFLHTLVRKSAYGSVFHLSSVIVCVHCLHMESNLYHTKSGDHYNRVLHQLGDLTSAGRVPSEPPKCNCGSCGASHKRTCPLNPRNRYTKSGK